MRARQRELARRRGARGARHRHPRVSRRRGQGLPDGVGGRARRAGARPSSGSPRPTSRSTIAERDRRDAAQLAPAPDAHTVDTTGLDGRAEAIERVLDLAARGGGVTRGRPGRLRPRLVGPAAHPQGRSCGCSCARACIGRRERPGRPGRCCSCRTTSRGGTSRRSARSQPRTHPLHGQARALPHPRSRWPGSSPGAGRSRSAAARPTATRCGSCTRRSRPAATVGIFIQGHRQAELDGAKAGRGPLRGRRGRCRSSRSAIRGTRELAAGHGAIEHRFGAAARATSAATGGRGAGLPRDGRRADGRDPAPVRAAG